MGVAWGYQGCCVAADEKINPVSTYSHKIRNLSILFCLSPFKDCYQKLLDWIGENHVILASSAVTVAVLQVN